MEKQMMKILSFLLFISFAAFAQEIDNKDKDAARANIDKDDFVVKAASGGMMEVELGKLAQEKGQSQEVKNLGEKMVRDHSKANDELRNIAQKNNIQLPEGMLDKHKEHVDELSELSGEEFDNAYLELMVEDHDEDVEMFEKASENYGIEDVREWANKTLGTLREHEELVNNIHNKVTE
jgi:putative membrane protein